MLSSLSVSYRPDSPRRANCLLYTSDAADDLIGVDLGGRRIIKKKKNNSVVDLIITNNEITTVHMDTVEKLCCYGSIIIVHCCRM